MKKRPNVLILLSDQQRYDTIAAAGFPHMKTPALDRLAARGTRYARAAMIVNNGVIDAVFVEDAPGVNASGAPAILMALEAA